jgi:hypothetical protein
LSVEGPDAPTTDEFEQIGRPFVTDPTARALLQLGLATLPVALAQPALLWIVQASPTREMFPVGKATVIEQFAPEVFVMVPPGHAINPSGVGKLLDMENVTWPAGQPAVHTRLPDALTPVTDWPLGQD